MNAFMTDCIHASLKKMQHLIQELLYLILMHWCILQKVSNINNLAFSIKSSKQATRKKSFRRTYESQKIGNMKILAFNADVY